MADRAVTIVIGNEKGGSGKSTTAMHLVVGLLRRGVTVGSIDLDARQGTLSRYVENRRQFAAEQAADLPMPVHAAIHGTDSFEVDRVHLRRTLDRLHGACQVIVIDTPGNTNPLASHAHSYADVLVTPINDSFIDLDVLARVEPDTLRIIRPSHYAELVFEERKRRAMHDGGSIEWVVLRNRLSALDAHNKRNMEAAVAALAKRIGFTVVGGFGERVIYRELFLKGLTMMDIEELTGSENMSMSHLAARQEVRTLIDALGLGFENTRAPTVATG